MGKIKEKLLEYQELYNAGVEAAECGDYETAEEYFSDANYVLNELPEDLRTKLREASLINTQDFAC